MNHRRRAFWCVISALIGASPLLPWSVRAQSAQDFLKGKTLNFVISSGTGGGYDALGRLVARYLADHLPANSEIIIRNMPGAGGIVATNYLFNAAPKDGTTIGLVQNNTPFAPLLGTKQAEYDASKFNWLGSPSTETGLLVVWHTVPVTSLADVLKNQITVASAGAGSTESSYAHMLNATLGTKLKIILGYPSVNEAFLAMQRGEVDGYPSIFYSSLMSTHPTWVKDGLLKVLVQFGPKKEPALGDVPFAPDLVKTDDDKLLMEAGFADLAVGRPFVAPPGVAADRVAILRDALAATFADPKFLADANDLKLVINEPRTGPELAQVIDSTYKMPSAIVDRLRLLYAQ